MANVVWHFGAGLLLLAGLTSTPAADRVLPAPGTSGWEHLRFPAVERATEYSALPDTGGVRAVSRCGASALVFALEGIDLDETPLLRWRWKIVRLPEVGDERQKSGDDFAARVYVVFPFEPARASRLERLRRLMAETVFGRELPGSALNYVRSSHEPAGTRWDNPYTADSKMVSVGRGPVAGWTEVEVDLRADHRAAFGSAARAPAAVALMTDSDDSCSQAEAWFADLRFSSPAPEHRVRP